jgi:voltage-gated potassium channel
MTPRQQRLHEILFEADTPAGKAFDVVLLLLILISIVAVMLQSVESINQQHAPLLEGIEWTITILFTIEYALRMLAVEKPLRYVFSFYGIIDLLAILPTWLSLFTHKTRGLIVLRSLRLLRVFRVFHMGRVLNEGNALARAVLNSRNKILVFMSVVLTIVLILGTAMYLVEGKESGFTSIPQSMYWAIVTMTTVGYGDIAPETVLGKIIASVMMFLGYSLIVVPTGIVTAEVSRVKPITTQSCPSCLREGHDIDAVHCKYCGETLNPAQS